MDETTPTSTDPSIHEPAHRGPARRRRRRRWGSAFLAVLTVVAVLGCVQVFSSRSSTSSSASAATSAFVRVARAVISSTGASAQASSHPGTPGGPPGAKDGAIPDGSHVSPFDMKVPAIAHLKPGLRAAVQKAATAAKADGIEFIITSGWRDQKYQRWLYQQQAARDGKAAKTLVATGGSSRHLSGSAVDIGFTDAASWMQQHGARWGLCQMYNNEIWHYELATTPGGVCPQPYLNAAARP